MPPSPAGSAAAVADRSPACRDRAERVAAESASRLPLSAQLPAHPEILVLKSPIAKPPSRPPKEVMWSESPEPDVYNCPH